MTGLRIGFAACWISLIAAELVAARSGLGYLIMDAREFLQTDVVIVGWRSSRSSAHLELDLRARPEAIPAPPRRVREALSPPMDKIVPAAWPSTTRSTAPARRSSPSSRWISAFATVNSSASWAVGLRKSTFLQLVAGLEPLTGGTIRMDGRAIEGPGADRGMVFQSTRSFHGARCSRTSSSVSSQAHAAT